MELIGKVSEKFAALTKDSPGFLHFDSTGFFRLATKKNTMLETLNSLFIMVEEKGGNLLLPSYSYSYTKNEVYSIKDSCSDLGRVSDYLRMHNPQRRTSDAIFSYLFFGEKLSRDFFLPKSYESFGQSSLMADVFNSDGYLMSVGDKLHYCTEVHFLEKMLNMSYRINKDFQGQILTLDGEKHDQTITYYCRDIDFSNKHNSIVSFERLFADMKKEQLIEEFVIDDSVEINAVKFQQVLAFLKTKLPHDPFYLMKDKTTSLPISHGKK